MEELIKSDAELFGNIEELREKFILIGFKGPLTKLLDDIIRAKQNKLDKVVFNGLHFKGAGTEKDPLSVIFPEQTELTDLEKRLSKVEAYINTLGSF